MKQILSTFIIKLWSIFLPALECIAYESLKFWGRTG